MTMHFIKSARDRGDASTTVVGTASHPWATRACQLLGIDPVTIDIDTIPTTPGVTRDEVAVEIGDSIDVIHVRSGGTILRLILDRLRRDSSASVHVLITSPDDRAAKTLIDAGAIGYWMPAPPLQTLLTEQQTPAPEQDLRAVIDATATHSLLNDPQRWLIHSTRARTGAWPGQSETQFVDWMLLAAPATTPASPIETLNRIIAQRRLIGTDRVTSTRKATVSLTALPIGDWLARRAYRSHLGRWDAEPYGIAIDRDAAKRIGVQPVVYGDPATRAAMPASERWRFQSIGKTYDWTQEHEWRAPGAIDLSIFAAGEVIVFVPSSHDAKVLQATDWPIVATNRLGEPVDGC